MIRATLHTGMPVWLHLENACLLRPAPGGKGTDVVWGVVDPTMPASGQDTVTQTAEALLAAAGLDWPQLRDHRGHLAYVNPARVCRLTTSRQGDTAVLFTSGCQMLSESPDAVARALSVVPLGTATHDARGAIPAPSRPPDGDSPQPASHGAGKGALRVSQRRERSLP